MPTTVATVRVLVLIKHSPPLSPSRILSRASSQSRELAVRVTYGRRSHEIAARCRRSLRTTASWRTGRAAPIARPLRGASPLELAAAAAPPPAAEEAGGGSGQRRPRRRGTRAAWRAPRLRRTAARSARIRAGSSLRARSSSEVENLGEIQRQGRRAATGSRRRPEPGKPVAPLE